MGTEELSLRSDVTKDKKYSPPKYYICVDLKSFYASVELVERNIPCLEGLLVVADAERGQGTICLAVSAALKKKGVHNRCRLYEALAVKGVEFIIAPPRMQLYMDYSVKIYEIFLSFFADEDIHVYSVDEAFIDISDYIDYYRKTPREIAKMVIVEIFARTNLIATAGVGTNLYLAKVALDIISKHAEDNIGILDEELYKRKLWNHVPLTDFWRIGKGTENRLNRMGLLTMRDVSLLAKQNDLLLYKTFGCDAELLIDHANGRETATMENIKNYKSKDHSINSGQVLLRDYSFAEAELVLKEMIDDMCLDMVDRNVTSKSFGLFVGYTHVLEIPSVGKTFNTVVATSSAIILRSLFCEIYEQIVLRNIPIRRINIFAGSLQESSFQQYDLFHSADELDRETKLQRMQVSVKNRFGKNSLLKGMNLETGGTAILRNGQIGGHRATGV